MFLLWPITHSNSRDVEETEPQHEIWRHSQELCSSLSLPPPLLAIQGSGDCFLRLSHTRTLKNDLFVGFK